jgi:lactate permease
MPTASVVPVLLAALPILLIVLLMLVAQWSAARAGVVGVVVAWAIAWHGFGYGQQIYPDVGTLAATAGIGAEALFTAGTILWIIFPALCIHHVQVQTGAIDVLRLALSRLSPDPRLVAVIVAWFFALFIEGAAGFGTTVALAAPLLVSLGFQPVAAVTMALLGHAVGVSFGAVGTPILPQMAATGLDALALSRVNGLYHSLLGWVMLGFVMATITAAGQDRGASPRPIWGWTLLAAVLFLVPYFLLSHWVGPELPTLGGALFGGLGFIALLRLRRARHVSARPDPAGAASSPHARDVLRAALPYVLLVALVLLTRLVTPLKHALTDVVWEWSWLGRFQGTIQPLYHPGTMLCMAFWLGACGQRTPVADLRAAMARAAAQLGLVTIALIAMLGLSRLMVHAGMITALAATAAELAGGTWPFWAPFMGILGTFVTGSATASNILFTDFQQAMAQHLGLSILTMAGAQGFGAAVGNVIAPHNIIAGGATVGLSGQEGAILRRTLWACVIYALLGGGITLWLTL